VDIEGVVPGWSMYHNNAYELNAALDYAGGRPWAAVEVGAWFVDEDLLRETLGYRNNQYLGIDNWNGTNANGYAPIKDNSTILNAIKKVLQERPPQD
jgi:hypothetical protein